MKRQSFFSILFGTLLLVGAFLPSCIGEDEKENILELKKDDVIGDVKEGDVLVKGKEGKFCLDKALTEKRKKEIEDLMKGMWE